MSYREEFERRVSNEWLNSFCDAKGYDYGGFDASGMKKISELDAADFIQALDSGLVHHRNGIFLAPQSRAIEQIFWECSKHSVPRRITLWLEPIITIAGLIRLNRDHFWKIAQLGLQSRTWAFDLVGYSRQDPAIEQLVCEVKKTEREINVLVELMHKHLKTPVERLHEFKGKERNALKKVVALRDSASSVFWALGPNGYGFVFNVARVNGVVSLHEADESSLRVNV